VDALYEAEPEAPWAGQMPGELLVEAVGARDELRLVAELLELLAARGRISAGSGPRDPGRDALARLAWWLTGRATIQRVAAALRAGEPGGPGAGPGVDPWDRPRTDLRLPLADRRWRARLEAALDRLESAPVRPEELARLGLR